MKRNKEQWEVREVMFEHGTWAAVRGNLHSAQPCGISSDTAA